MNNHSARDFGVRRFIFVLPLTAVSAIGACRLETGRAGNPSPSETAVNGATQAGERAGRANGAAGANGGGAAPRGDGGASAGNLPSDGAVQRFTPPGASGAFSYFAAFPIDQPNSALQLKAAVVIVHGLPRDANVNFALMTQAAKLAAGAKMALNDENTLIVAPHFEATGCSTGDNSTVAGDLLWGCDAWSDGSAATNDANMTSYGVIDAMVAAIHKTFPSIASIIVAGHSAGGQFVQRYAGVGKSPDPGANPVTVRYVVASPSSYLYLDARRPSDAPNCTWTGTAASCPDSVVPGSTLPKVADAAKGCATTFDNWKYGLEQLSGAAAASGATTIAETYLGRDVAYLLADKDTGKSSAAYYSVLDKTCPAEAQGVYRYDRGLAFVNYIQTVAQEQNQSSTPRVAVATGCAHDPTCVFQSPAGLGIVFGRR